MSFRLTFFFLLAFFVLASLRCSAVFENSLRLEFPVVKKEVDVSPGGNGTTTFAGTLIASTDYYMEITLKVKVEGTGGEEWAASVSPSAVTVGPGTHEISTEVSVKAPTATPHDTTGVVVVDVRGVPWGTGVPIDADQQLFVRPKPYGGLTLRGRIAYVETRPYGIVIVRLTAKNIGNMRIDDLKVEVTSVRGSGAGAGWLVWLPATYLRLEVDQSVDVPIRFQAPQEWTLWRDDITAFKIYCCSHRTNSSAAYTIYVRVRGSYLRAPEPWFLFLLLPVLVALVGKKKRRFDRK